MAKGKGTRIVPLKQDEIRAILKDNGFVSEGPGTHGEKFHHPQDSERRALVPDRDPVSVGLVKAIIKQSVKPREHFTR